MSPLKTALAAGLALVAGWGAHEAIARAPGHPEQTAPSVAQEQAARKAEGVKAVDEADVKARGGMIGADGSVLTPLNVRDPSALVMGPGPACAPAAPCDCAAEKLKKAGREAPERF
jgi:hypothetical protein